MAKSMKPKECNHERYHSWTVSDAKGNTLYVGCCDCGEVLSKELKDDKT